MFDHFHEAQAPIYDRALAELRVGQKRSHWMWFIFPQIAGLGRSPMAQRFALSGLDEARHYLADPLLGARLREVTLAVLGHPDRSLAGMFGSPDDLKWVSSMTLFHRAAPDDPLFKRALDVFNNGREDEATLSRI